MYFHQVSGLSSLVFAKAGAMPLHHPLHTSLHASTHTWPVLIF